MNRKPSLNYLEIARKTSRELRGTLHNLGVKAEDTNPVPSFYATKNRESLFVRVEEAFIGRGYFGSIRGVRISFKSSTPVRRGCYRTKTITKLDGKPFKLHTIAKEILETKRKEEEAEALANSELPGWESVFLDAERSYDGKYKIEFKQIVTLEQAKAIMAILEKGEA